MSEKQTPEMDLKKAKTKAYRAVYFAANPEKEKTYSAKYYAANREEINARKRASRAAKKAEKWTTHE